MVDFEEAAQDALDAFPRELRSAMSNVSIVFEDEPPDGHRCSDFTRASR